MTREKTAEKTAAQTPRPFKTVRLDLAPESHRLLRIEAKGQVPMSDLVKTHGARIPVEPQSVNTRRERVREDDEQHRLRQLHEVARVA